MRRYTVRGPRPLHGSVRVPGDKSVSHRALLLSALAPGRSTITGLSDGDDVVRTAVALGALGVGIGVDAGSGACAVDGGSLRSPEAPLDMGNSGTGLRLLMGLLAGQPVAATLTGDDSLRSRPMDRVAIPLRQMGATIEGDRAPLTVHGGRLRGIDYSPPMASAQVKSAILLAGLGAAGETVVREPAPTRRHTEEMLAEAGADVTVDGTVVRLQPSALEPRAWTVPGDPSQGAFWVVAGCCVPGSDVTVEDLYLGPGRDGFLAVLERMGADLDVDRTTGTVRARATQLRATEVAPEEVPGLIDEVPVLAVAAAVAEGETTFAGLGELRVKESDRLATVAEALAALGADVAVAEDRLRVSGGGLRGGRAASHGDHRIAMALAIGGLAAAGETEIDGWEAVDTSYPGFAADLEALT